MFPPLVIFVAFQSVVAIPAAFLVAGLAGLIERYRAAGKNKDDVPINQFRAECRTFARDWVTIQAGEFKRLGVVGDWANPYTTMHLAAEAQITREIHKFLVNGGLYKGVKPVLWSVVEKTALADAEDAAELKEAMHKLADVEAKARHYRISRIGRSSNSRGPL